MTHKQTIFGIFILFSFSAISCQAQKGKREKVELKTKTDSVSYALGQDMAANIKGLGIEINADAMAKAIKDVLKGEQTLLSPEESKNVMKQFQQDMQAKSNTKNNDQGAKNKSAGEAFLKENAKKEGVNTTSSGMQYIVLNEGTGPKPKLTDKVKTHYHGTLINGTVFDSSVERGQPISFPVNGVIQGWQEALQMMPVGSKWKLFIPSHLAYGERGPSPKIGPGSTLIFEIELLAIE